jgi:hypothetical protein
MSNVDGTVGGILAGIGCILLLAKLAFLGMIVYGIYYFIFHFMPAMIA